MLEHDRRRAAAGERIRLGPRERPTRDHERHVQAVGPQRGQGVHEQQEVLVAATGS